MELQQAFDEGFEAVKKYIDEAFVEYEKRFAALEKRAIDRVDQLKYVGVYDRGVRYREGNFVTRDGSLWCAKRDTHETPGESDAWQLAVKRGKDAIVRSAA
jgi:hypothetical protein